MVSPKAVLLSPGQGMHQNLSGPPPTPSPPLCPGGSVVPWSPEPDAGCADGSGAARVPGGALCPHQCLQQNSFLFFLVVPLLSSLLPAGIHFPSDCES